MYHNHFLFCPNRLRISRVIKFKYLRWLPKSVLLSLWGVRTGGSLRGMRGGSPRCGESQNLSLDSLPSVARRTHPINKSHRQLPDPNSHSISPTPRYPIGWSNWSNYQLKAPSHIGEYPPTSTCVYLRI